MKQLFLICFFTSLIANAQDNLDLSYYLPQDVTYNKNIPTPESVLGYPVGKWHVTHDKLVQYMHALANASDRISIENRGRTYEDRPLSLLTISSPENLSNIKTIQSTHIDATDSDIINTNRPIVVYQGFSIHGNEPSGSNAALLVAYYLAAAEGDYITELLSNTVILLDASLNPDGLQRFAYWANTNKNKNLSTDPKDREYNEVWPRGRTNHYWFDLNRDWLPAQLPESQARVETFHNWLPNILTDHHEMGSNSSFFFQPGIPTRTHPLTPKLNQELTKAIGDYHAKALDEIGSLYYTEEDYDDFYYGKGSTFPDINGGIGILFEQGSSRGHAQETKNGVLTFPFTIRNQFTAALSTLKAAKNLKTDILTYQQNFYKNARVEATTQAKSAIAFGNSKNAANTYHLAEILKRHKIKFYDVKQDFSVNNKEFKKGYSYIIPKNQKNTRLIKAMFEKRTTFQDSLFYDISAWTFPLAFNLDYEENVSINKIGTEITNLKPKEGGVTELSEYAYLMEWHEYYTPKVLYKILSKGLRAKVAMRKFSLNNKQYDYGTILIPVENQGLNATDLHNYLNNLAKSTHVTIDAAFTGLTPKGIDLGSSKFTALKTPKIALLVGEGVTSYDAGEIWHLLDQRYDIAITKLDVKTINKADLSKYTTIIIPNMKTSALSKTQIEKIKEWVKSGGSIIGYRNTVKWLNKNEFIKLELKDVDVPAKNISFEQKNDFKGAQEIGGAIFGVDLDRSHPISYGYKNKTLTLFRNTKVFVKPDSLSYNNPIIYHEKPLYSGYISAPNLEALSKSVPFQVKKLGKGKVIVFTDNTNFRAFWFGTNKLLMNAIFFRDQL